MNLTFEIREGIVKHSRDYNAEQYSELKEYRLDERPPIEAQLIDVADEIAYNCADLDDGYEAKLLTLGQIRESVPQFGGLLRPIERKHPNAMEKLKFNEALKGLMDSLVTDLIKATRERLQRMRMRTVEDVRAAPSRVVGFSPRMSRETQALKAFLRDNLYTHREIYDERRKIVRCVAQMFKFYMEHPRSLPPFYFGKTKEGPTHRVVCDYIAGMTDNYLAELHRKCVEG